MFNRYITNRALALLLAALFAFALAPGALGVVQGAFDITGTLGGWTYGSPANTLTITANGTYTITMATPGAQSTTDRIVVESGLTDVNITLSGVNIDVSPSNYCAFDMSGATVNLTLQGDNTLESGTNCAGLHVPGGAKLTIYGSGSLSATSAYGGAGIGGNSGEDGGDITITGGTILAIGGDGDSFGNAGVGGGAGIGGGGLDGPNIAPSGNSGSITIKGDATVEATGGSGADSGDGGAGIGSGGSVMVQASGDVISIRIDTSGTVTATGGSNIDPIPGTSGGGGGAGIGSGGTVLGVVGTADNIKITSSRNRIIAIGGTGIGGNGAGIGTGGRNGQAGTEIDPFPPGLPVSGPLKPAPDRPPPP